MSSFQTSRAEPSHTPNQEETSSEGESVSVGGSHLGGRLTWTEKMCVDLMVCKEKAEELHRSENCPRKENGRKEGKMNLTLHFWNNMGYEHLKKSAQNLRDKLSHIEKKTKATSSQILEEIRQQQRSQAREQPQEQTTNQESQRLPTRYANHLPVNQDNENTTLHNQSQEYVKLLQTAQDVYQKVISQPGSWSNREENTFTRRSPDKTQASQLQNIAQSLIKTNPAENPTLFLWECNCAIYATAVAFKRVTMENKATKASQRKEQKEKPRWLITLEQEVTKLRKQTSQITEEINRIKNNKKMTKKMWKNRKWIGKEIRGKMNIKELVTLKEKKINMLRKLKNDRKKKLLSTKRRRINYLFDKDQGKFYGHLRNILNHDTTDDPKFTEFDTFEKSNENTLNKEQFEQFWTPLWESAHDESLDDCKWIAEVRQALEEAGPERVETPIVVTKEIIHKCLKKKKNWSAPGLDKITNFWLKHLSSLHHPIATAVTSLINSVPSVLPDWISEGRTVMIPKKENPKAQDFRPITCLNTMYKLITSVINVELESHLSKYHLMQLDQRGGVKGSMGCVDNLLIDKAILEDACKNKKNLSCLWIDVKKAFDSVSHAWLSMVLKDHGINKKLSYFIENIIKSWRTTLYVSTAEGPTAIGPIKINRGILQGDSFCHIVYSLP